MTKTTSSNTVATVRTTVNTAILAAVLALTANRFGWTVKAKDLLPYMPAIIPIVAVFYRLTRFIADRWPAIGVVLFGISTPPAYHPPAPPLPDDRRITPPTGGN